MSEEIKDDKKTRGDRKIASLREMVNNFKKDNPEFKANNNFEKICQI